MTRYTGLSHFVTSMTAPVASGWSDSCRVELAPTEERLTTAHTQRGHSWRWAPIEKTYRFIMSHRTGKIEILDLDDRGHLYLRYHQCKDLDKIGRIFSLACPKDALWLDDLYTDE